MAARMARRSAGGKFEAFVGEERELGRGLPGAIRTTATSIPSAEVPLMMPATVIAFALMLVGSPAAWVGRCDGLAEALNPGSQRSNFVAESGAGNSRAKSLARCFAVCCCAREKQIAEGG